MPTLAVAATGTQVHIATIAVPSGELIPELRNATDIGMAFAMVDVSAHDGNGWSSMIPTLKRGKPITLELNYVPGNAAHQLLFSAAQSRESVSIKVILPTTGNPNWLFNAFVGDIGIPAVPVDGALPLRVILTPDGTMTFS